MKKTKPKKKQAAAKAEKNTKKISEHLLDRDKNETYIPNDESIDIAFDSEGHEEFIHPNHNNKKKNKGKK